MPALEEGHTYEKGESGKTPHWRGIYDDHGRIMVAMCHNMDLGDSWEHADDPQYPARYSDLGIRIGINYAFAAPVVGPLWRRRLSAELSGSVSSPSCLVWRSRCPSLAARSLLA